MSTHEFADYDAAYVLGSLSPEDRRSFEEHLAECDRCARAVRELAGMPGLLGTVSVDDLEADPGPVPDTLLPGLVRAVRRRRRRTALVAAAGAAAVLAGVVAVGAAVGLGEDAPTAQGPPVASPGATSGVSPALGGSVPMRAVGQSVLSADLTLEHVRWGTRLTLVCDYAPRRTYAGGELPAYALVVHDANGDTERVSTWRAVAGQETTVSAGTSWAPSDIASVEVRTMGGRPALRLRR